MSTRMIDHTGHEFWTDDAPDPEAVWLPTEAGTLEPVPWAIARHYPNGTSVDEIVADLAAEQEVEA